MKKNMLLAAGLLLSAGVFATVRLPKIFGDSMVLQRDKPIAIWGWADAGEKITVHFNKQTQTLTTPASGKWSVQLHAEAAGGPYELKVSGTNTIALKDILMGDVWICSGQSNMEFMVKQARNADQEIQSANYPNIRHFLVPKDVSGTPKEDITGNNTWQTATPGNVGNFTAVGYFFARKLYKELNVPIGLVHTSWGGTDVETWTSREALETVPELKEAIAGMNTTDLESIAKAQKEKAISRIRSLQGSLPDAATVSKWKTAGFDDHTWPQMSLPGLWEGKQLPDFDGVVWFRKTVNIDASAAGKPAVLSLGAIDDADETYVNGIKVGGVRQYDLERVYNIPAGVLKAGKNVIAVRVEDTGGGGGLYGPDAAMKLTIDGTVLPLTGNWAFQVASMAAASGGVSPNAFPSLLYNAMVHPILPMSIKGAIWYQGENNAGRAYQYRTSFPLLITDWRKRWHQGNFPFYFVQLSSFGGSDGLKGSDWAELREAQAMTLSLPNTGMAVTIDVGEAKDIHPKNKQDVGERLAAVALHKTYGKNNAYSGPVYASMKTEGSNIVLSFTYVGSGLQTKDHSDKVKGFYIAGADQHFYEASASIQGNLVVVHAAEVSNPVAVRYAWSNDAGAANLYNKDGFPAAPFRTDQWKGVTEGKMYKK